MAAWCSAAVLAALAFLLSYALALAPLWAALTLGRRGGLRAAVAAAVGALAVLALLAVDLGYDPIGAVRGTHEAYERGIGGTGRPFWYWLFAGPAVFLIGLGPVLAERFLRGVELATAGARAVAACIVLGALSGVMEAEVERIWQFMIPFAAVAAAPLVSRRAVTSGDRRGRRAGLRRRAPLGYDLLGGRSGPGPAGGTLDSIDERAHL